MANKTLTVIVASTLNATIDPITSTVSSNLPINFQLNALIDPITIGAVGTILVSSQTNVLIDPITFVSTGAVIENAQTGVTIDPITNNTIGTVFVSTLNDNTIDPISFGITGTVFVGTQNDDLIDPITFSSSGTVFVSTANDDTIDPISDDIEGTVLVTVQADDTIDPITSAITTTGGENLLTDVTIDPITAADITSTIFVSSQTDNTLDSLTPNVTSTVEVHAQVDDTIDDITIVAEANQFGVIEDYTLNSLIDPITASAVFDVEFIPADFQLNSSIENITLSARLRHAQVGRDGGLAWWWEQYRRRYADERNIPRFISGEISLPLIEVSGEAEALPPPEPVLFAGKGTLHSIIAFGGLKTNPPISGLGRFPQVELVASTASGKRLSGKASIKLPRLVGGSISRIEVKGEGELLPISGLGRGKILKVLGGTGAVPYMAHGEGITSNQAKIEIEITLPSLFGKVRGESGSIANGALPILLSAQSKTRNGILVKSNTIFLSMFEIRSVVNTFAPRRSIEFSAMGEIYIPPLMGSAQMTQSRFAVICGGKANIPSPELHILGEHDPNDEEALNALLHLVA